MRSADGLAINHASDENLRILSEILKEHGLSDEEIDEASKAIKGTIETQKNPDSRPQQVTVDSLTNYKKMVDGAPDHILKVLKKYDKDGRFSAMYDTIQTIEEAIKIYESSEYSQIVNEFDSFVRKGLGRGELVFVFLIKGCKSGGTTDVDLVDVPVHDRVDVKEMVGSDIAITFASIKGLAQSEFKKSLDELADFLKKNPSAGEFIVNVLRDDTNYKGDRPAANNEIKGVEAFCRAPNVNEVAGSIFTGLSLVGNKLASTKKPGSPDNIGIADISIGDSHKKFFINNSSELKSKINIPTNNNGKNILSLDVNPIEQSDSVYIEAKVRSLSYFKNETSQASVTDTIFSLLKRHFNGGIVLVEKAKGNKATFIDMKYIKNFLTFSRITQGNIKLKKVSKK